MFLRIPNWGFLNSAFSITAKLIMPYSILAKLIQPLILKRFPALQQDIYPMRVKAWNRLIRCLFTFFFF